MALSGPDHCPSALQPRLKCLIHIVKKLTAEHEEFITALVPEVRMQEKVLCVFWGFLGVWLLKARQDQGRVMLGAGVGLTR